MASKALSHQMSRTVRVNRQKLIETLTENRAKHIHAFNEAMDGYKELALAKIEESFRGLNEKLSARKAELTDKVNKFSPETADQFSDHFVLLNSITIPLTVPVSYADAYDAAIDMATFDTREELELSGAEFQCFCRDVWDWSYDFTTTTMNYSVANRRKD